MLYTINPVSKKQKISSFRELFIPVHNIFDTVPPLEAKGGGKGDRFIVLFQRVNVR
jgi:hypothetical protein